MDGLPGNLRSGWTRPNDPKFATRGVSLRERIREATRQLESEIIRETLERHRWNRRRTAEALKISYRSLMYKMKHCQLRESVAPAADREREGGKTL